MALQPIFSAGSQGVKVRAIQLLSLASLALFGWLAWLVMARPSPADPSSPAARMVVAAFSAGVGLLFVAGMWIYGKCYVTSVDADVEQRRLHVTLAGFLFPSRIDVPFDAIRQAADHDGRFDAGGVSVNAPWTTIHLQHRLLPLVIDRQGEVHDQALFEQALLPAPPKRRRRALR